METTIKTELAQHILDRINDGVIDDTNRDDWHFYCFNEDYYLIGYYECSEWLKAHGIGELEGASICNQYEVDNFGETSNKYDNTESVVNMLAYIYGEELIYGVNADTIEDLEAEIKELVE